MWCDLRVGIMEEFAEAARKGRYRRRLPRELRSRRRWDVAPIRAIDRAYVGAPVVHRVVHCATCGTPCEFRPGVKWLLGPTGPHLNCVGVR